MWVRKAVAFVVRVVLFKSATDISNVLCFESILRSCTSLCSPATEYPAEIRTADILDTTVRTVAATVVDLRRVYGFVAHIFNKERSLTSVDYDALHEQHVRAQGEGRGRRRSARRWRRSARRGIARWSAGNARRSARRASASGGRRKRRRS